jgi:hypothetical protein
VRYEALIDTATVGLGIAYAAALHPDIYHAVHEHVLPPETLAGAMACLGLAGLAGYAGWRRVRSAKPWAHPLPGR